MYPIIKHITIYPVKSCGGIELDEATLNPDGLEYGMYRDHEFMTVRAREGDDGIHDFLTQRDMRHGKDRHQGLSDMTSVKPTHDGDSMHLTWNYSDPIELPYDKNKGRQLPVRVWEGVFHTVDQGDELAKWLSDHLDLSVRLVKAAGSFSRKARQDYIKNDNPLLFQDGYPIHWFSQESLDELSQIAGYNIPWQTFRPQMVTEGMKPSEEHEIYSGYVGHDNVRFINAKPCDRCPVTNIDQYTGDVKIGRALKPLSVYKKWLNNDGKLKVIFGENMLPLESGVIRNGDPIHTQWERSGKYAEYRVNFGPDVKPI